MQTLCTVSQILRTTSRCDLQASKRQDTKHSSLLLSAHLKLEYLRNWDQQHNDVGEQVDNGQNDKELANINACSLGTFELCPVVAYRRTAKYHGEQEYHWI